MSHEFYKKYRPTSFKGVLGQDASVKPLLKMVKDGKVPHSLLFTGPSGCGKTTLARILRSKLECGDRDFQETNCADFRGIDSVRDMRRHMGLAPVNGKVRIFLIDEVHKMTNDAQNAILKMLEDTPRHVYFMLCTTDPGKLIDAIKTRCTEIKVRPLDDQCMKQLIAKVTKLEGCKLSEPVIEKLVEAAQGSARKALVILEQVLSVEGDSARLEAIEMSQATPKVIEIARKLINGGTTWTTMQKLLKEIPELRSDPEGLRHMVLGYATSILLGPNKKLWPRAFLVADIFRDNFYDSKHNGFVAACYELVTGGK